MKTNSMCVLLSLTDSSSKDLQPLTRFRPVAGLPFAGRYRVIDFLLSSISHGGVDSVGLFIGGSGRSIYDHIRSGAAWGLESKLRGGIFTFSQTYLKQLMGDESFEDDNFYANHKAFLHKSLAKYVFVSGGKIVAKVNLKDVQAFHASQADDVTLIYKTVPVDAVKDHPYEKIVIADSKHKLKSLISSLDWNYQQKTVGQSMNMYLLSVKTLLDIIERADREGIHMDIDRLVAYYLPSLNVNAYEYKGPMSNLDSIEAYFEANMSLLDKAEYDKVFCEGQPVITKAKSEAPTYYYPKANVNSALVATGCSISGTVEESLVFRKVCVEEDAEVRHSLIMQGAKIGKGAILEYCILDKNVTIEPGVVLKGTKDKLIVIEKNKRVTAEG